MSIMSISSDQFHTNRLYQLLVDRTNYSEELLGEVNTILHAEPELAQLTHPIEGSYFHLVCQNSNDQER